MPLEIIGSQPRVLSRDSGGDEWVMPLSSRVGFPGKDQPALAEPEVQRLVHIRRRFNEYVPPANSGVRYTILDIDWHSAGLDEDKIVLAAVVLYQQAPRVKSAIGKIYAAPLKKCEAGILQPALSQRYCYTRHAIPDR